MRSPLLLRTIPTFQFDTWHTFTDVRPSQMMDNELAKELKQAGFPQSHSLQCREVLRTTWKQTRMAKLTLSLFPPSKNS